MHAIPYFSAVVAFEELAMQGPTYLLILSTILFEASFVVSQDCIPLRQCSSLMALLENKNGLPPQVSTIDIFTVLRSSRCGFDGNDPLVWCQDEEAEEGDDIIDRQIIINRDAGPELVCDGMLTVIHMNPTSGLRSMKTSRLQGPVFYNIRRRILRNRRILHLRVDGNCCWKLHAIQNFRGAVQYLKPGHEASYEGSFQPSSIKRVLCSTLPPN